MGDQPPDPTEPDDSESQPREDKLSMDRWLAQQPREDGVPFTFEWRGPQGILPEEAQSEEQARDDNISDNCLHHVAGCQVIGVRDWSLTNHNPPYHHQNTKGDCGQLSSNAHDTTQLEDVFALQQQEHLTHVLFSSSGQDTLEQPFNQASLPSGPQETADCSGISYGAIQRDNEVDQWLDNPDATFIDGITYDRRRALLQLYGKVQQELSTIDSASGSQQAFAPEHSEFNSNLYSSRGYSINGTSVTHPTKNFGCLGTNQPRGYTPPRHPGLIDPHFSAHPSLIEPWGYGSTTIPSYSSDTRSRAMDEVSSEMTLSTAPTTDKSLYRNIGRYNLEPTHVLHPNRGNMIKHAPDSLEAQNHCSDGLAQHAMKRIRPSQYCKSERKSKKRRVGKIREDENDINGYNCPFYLKNPADYGVGNWELCAKGRWRTYQRMRLLCPHPPGSASIEASTNCRREHLLRKHIRPAVLCERCFEEFEDGDSLREHFESPCERETHSPYMSLEQQSQLQTRIKGGMEEAKKLEQMYHIFSINGAFPSPESNRQMRLEILLRSAIAFSLIPPGDIERITNDALQAIRSAGFTGGIEHEHEHDSQGCDGIKNVQAVSSGITEHAPVDIAHKRDNGFLQLGN